MLEFLERGRKGIQPPQYYCTKQLLVCFLFPASIIFLMFFLTHLKWAVHILKGKVSYKFNFLLSGIAKSGIVNIWIDSSEKFFCGKINVSVGKSSAYRILTLHLCAIVVILPSVFLRLKPKAA